MINPIQPLRTSIGRALSIQSITLVAHSDLLQPGQIRIVQWPDAAAVQASAIFREFHPGVWLDGAGAAPAFAPEVPTFRIPSDAPLAIPAPFFGLFILGPKAEDLRDSRRLWARFRLTIRHVDPDEDGTPLIGGLFLGGFPYMPSVLMPHGEPLANHGLPREFRVTWRSGDGSFIDDTISHTQQLPAMHSSHHVLPIGPIATTRLELHVSDLPRRLHTFRSWDPNKERYDFAWGMAIPFIVPFEYTEQVVRHVNLRPGVVCATQTNRRRGASFFAAALDATADPFWDGAESAHIHTQKEKAYPFTPQSAVIDPKSRREYPLGPEGQLVQERFISSHLSARGDQVHLLLAQRDEQCRCIAGLRLELTSNRIRRLAGADGAPAYRVKVYEVDPLPGAAIPEVRPSFGRFARLLVDEKIAKEAEGEHVLRFSRPTLNRWLYLVFTAEDPGHIAIDSIALVRSATVSLMPRPSRTQRLRAVHFRLLGPMLGEDYASLGAPGFSMAIDHVVAGERRDRLLSAHSLEELVRSGTVRLLTNSRARAIERQVSRVDKGSFASTQSRTRSKGWDRSESGDDFEFQHGGPGPNLAPDGEHGFVSMSNDEVRTHVRHVANIPNWYRNLIESRFGSLHDDTDPSEDLLWQAANGQSVWAPWRATTAAERSALKLRLEARGLWNVSLPPYFRRMIDRVQNNGGSLSDMFKIEEVLNGMNDDLFLINGASFGFSRGFGVLIPNFSWSNTISASGVSTALQAHSIGTTGSVSRSARQTGYSYQQSLTNQGSFSENRQEYIQSLHSQVVERRIADGVPMPDARIRGAETQWQNGVTDLIIGVLPLDYELPATNESGFRTTDEAIRVTFSGLDSGVVADAWFEVIEEMVRDDQR